MCAGGPKRKFSLPSIDERQILKWADECFNRTNNWPNKSSGPVHSAEGETWLAIDASLRDGRRGLAGGSSLAELLRLQRGKRNHLNLPRLDEEIILKWADDHFDRKGTWPKEDSGAVLCEPGETWIGITTSLRAGARGLLAVSSLARLLETRRGVRNFQNSPSLEKEQILQWVDQHFERTGDWPNANSGKIPGSYDETWTMINNALKKGTRGLPANSSLARLLESHRSVRNTRNPPALEKEQILKWADQHFKRTGNWPGQRSGEIFGSHGETWTAVAGALIKGSRGLPGGSSLAVFLQQNRGVRNIRRLPLLDERQILKWADDHFKRTGDWPGQKSGEIPDSHGETWNGMNYALGKRRRGLPGGSSLADLLHRHRAVRNMQNTPPLNERTIIKWAREVVRRTGSCPSCSSNPVLGVPGENWNAIDAALRKGLRGLPGGSSLPILLVTAGLK